MTWWRAESRLYLSSTTVDYSSTSTLSSTSSWVEFYDSLSWPWDMIDGWRNSVCLDAVLTDWCRHSTSRQSLFLFFASKYEKTVSSSMLSSWNEQISSGAEIMYGYYVYQIIERRTWQYPGLQRMADVKQDVPRRCGAEHSNRICRWSTSSGRR